MFSLPTHDSMPCKGLTERRSGLLSRVGLVRAGCVTSILKKSAVRARKALEIGRMAQGLVFMGQSSRWTIKLGIG